MTQEIEATHGFFVTGTDTEIGKTLVSSALILAMAQRGWRSVGMKPVAAGAELIGAKWCNEDVEALTAASNLPNLGELGDLINPYLFRLPAAPHIAAREEQREIQLQHIVDCYGKLRAQAQAIVVEGVGGFRVPLNGLYDTADMAQQLQLPVILVVGLRLGCINHALLTAEAIKARGLRLAAWVGNSAQSEMPYLQDNVTALQAALKVPCLGCIPHLAEPRAELAVKHLDLSILI